MLSFYYGTMGSGKSLILLAKVHNLEKRGRGTLVLKSSVDDRDGVGVIHSRALGSRDCEVIHADMNIFEFVAAKIGEDEDRPLEWVFVDECQFLSEEQIDQLSDLSVYYGLNIMCYGLRTDFRTRLFPGSKRLFEIADHIEEIEAPCDCGRNTVVNARVDMDGNIVTDGEQVEVGGDDRYVPYCMTCYKSKNGGIDSMISKIIDLNFN